MIEHTPGQWEAMKPAKTGKRWRVGARGKLGGKGAIAGASVLFYVAHIDNGAPGDTLETEAANARLIAACPNMYAALREALAMLNDGRQTDAADLIETCLREIDGNP